MKYERLAKEIIQVVGGEGNIISLVHCATRLRFTLKDESKADDNKANQINGVLSLVKKGGQYQLVIGNNVHDVYEDILKLANIKDSSVVEEKAEKDTIVNRVLGAITGSLVPLIPALAGVGMGKVLLLVLNLLGILPSDTQTYAILNFIFDTGFYFMPVFIGFSSAKIFKCNEYLGAFMGLALLHPAWTAMVAAGEPVEFLGIPVSLVRYASSIIPVLLSVWLMSHVDRFVRKVVPGILKLFGVPLLVILISVPLALVVIGPVGNYLSLAMSAVVVFIQKHFGFLAIGILSAVYPWLVTTGMHTAIGPVGLNLLMQTGYDPITRTIALCSNMSQAAAGLAVAIKTKNKDLKSLAMSSSITGFLGGITEPIMYGVNLKLKKPMYACMIGGGVAGLFAGIVQLKAYAMVTPGLLSLPMWIPPEGHNLIYAIITVVIAVVVSFISTLIIGFDDPEMPSKEEKKEDDKKIDKVNLENKIPMVLGSPLSGELVPLETVPDKTFASKIMGEGIAINPSEGKVYAPCDSVVSATFPSGHAIGLTTKDGVELLIHVGIDTVELEGKYFETKVKNNQEVKKGELLIEFDMNKVASEGYNTVTMIMVTNSDQYLEVVPVNKEAVKATEELITVI